MSSQNLDDLELENGLDTIENQEENRDFGEEMNYYDNDDNYYENEGQFVGEFGEFEGEYEDGGVGKYGLEGDEEEEDEGFTWWFWAILACLGVFVVFVVIGATLFFVLSSGDSTAADDSGPPTYQHNLPNLVSPIEYNLDFQVFLPGYLYKIDERNWTFEGNSSIKLKVLDEKIDKFYMHSAKNLSVKISNISIITNENQIFLDNLKISRYSPDVIEISLGRFVEKNATLKVDLSFAGKIENNPGIYKSIFYNQKNEEKNGIVTKFSGEFARFVLPCFDEPKWKTIWNIRLIHPKKSYSYGNQVNTFKEKDVQFRNAIFQPTPLISTNQIGFVIGNWDCNHKTKYDNRVEIKICGRGEITQKMSFVKNDAVKILKQFEDSFAQKYPLNVLTILAAPDFSKISSKPQSSLGLILFDENDLLLEEDEVEKAYSAKRLEIRANFIGQIASQWFSGKIVGNWNDVWVNEGLIGLFGAFGASFLATSDSIRESRILVPKIQKLGLENPNPLTFDLQTEKNLPEKIENINSGKSVGIMRMIRKMVGKAIFSNSIKKYLENDNSKTLLEIIQKVYDESQEKPSGPSKIVEVAKNWAENAGYPVIFVEKNGKENVKLTQKIWNFKTGKIEENELKFEIPLLFWNEEKNNEKLMWLKADPLIIPSKSGPFILNLDSIGFYRVKYSDEIFESIASKLSEKSDFLTPNTKFRIIEDALFFNNSKIELLNKYILAENHPIPLTAFLKNRKIEEIWNKSKEIKGDWEIVENNYRNDSFIDQVESNLLVIAEKCRSKTEDCLKKSKFYWENLEKDCKNHEMLSTCSKIPSPIRKFVICLANSKETEEKLRKWKENEKDLNVLEDLEYAITCGGGKTGENEKRKNYSDDY